jgi:O-antigen/teichoic acid export membrane protein
VKDETLADEQNNLVNENTEAGRGSLYLPHIARGAIINFTGIAAHMVFAYGYTFMLARMLPVDELGQFFIIVTIINLLGLAAVVGLDMGVVRFVSLYAGQRDFTLARKTLRTGL